MSFRHYDGNSAQQRLNDIATAFANIREFIEGMTREQFVNDDNKIVQFAVVRALEEACEAAYWFTKHENGATLRASHPAVNFSRFGLTGNVFRHMYGSVDYGVVWDDILHGPDIAAMETLLVSEIPGYVKRFSVE